MAKQKKLRELASEFLSNVERSKAPRGEFQVRFDVACVIVPRDGPPEVTILEDAF